MRVPVSDARSFERFDTVARSEFVVQDDVGQRADFTSRSLGDIVKVPLLLFALSFKSLPSGG